MVLHPFMAERNVVGHSRTTMNCSFADIEPQYVLYYLYIEQWRIQDFPGGRGAKSKWGRGRKAIIWPFFPENCMNLKNIGLEERGIPLIRHCPGYFLLPVACYAIALIDERLHNSHHCYQKT